jgi:hypothetical protein
MEEFDSVLDQSTAWANKQEKEKDRRALIHVIRLVFENATDEPVWSEMYACLCRKTMEQISSKVQEDGIKNAEGSFSVNNCGIDTRTISSADLVVNRVTSKPQPTTAVLEIHQGPQSFRLKE